MWRACADNFIGPSIKDAIQAFEHFQGIMNDRYKKLLATGRRKIARDSGDDVYLIPIDEYAYSPPPSAPAPAGDLRGPVPRPGSPGPRRRCHPRPGHQRPSTRSSILHAGPVLLPVAFRCTTDSSSDVVLGQGWAAEGYTAADIDPLARGVGWLAEAGVPRRIKAAYLDDDTIKYLAAYAARLRGKDTAP